MLHTWTSNHGVLRLAGTLNNQQTKSIKQTKLGGGKFNFFQKQAALKRHALNQLYGPRLLWEMYESLSAS